MTPRSVPKSLIIVGAGVIGIEFASMYQSLGTKVTLLEAAPSILMREDKAISDFVKYHFESIGIDIICGIQL